MERDAAPRKDFVQDIKTERPKSKAWVAVTRNGIKGGICYSSEIEVRFSEASARFEQQKIGAAKDKDDIILEFFFGGEVVEKWIKP